MDGLICIIAAMDIEFSAIIESFGIKSLGDGLDSRFRIGVCENKRVIVAHSGVGKAKAEACAEAIYAKYDSINGFISAGMAGAVVPNLNIGEIVIGDAVFEEMQGLYEKVYETKRSVIKSTAKRNIRIGPVFCSDGFFSDAERKIRLHESTGALCVEMESAGIARFALKNGIPFVSVKAISDHADGKALRLILRSYKETCEGLAIYLSETVENIFWETER